MKNVCAGLFLLALVCPALAQNAALSERLAEDEMFTRTWPTAEAQVLTTSLSPASALSPEGGCVPNATTLCLLGGQYQVRIIFSAPSLGITNAPAQAVLLTSDTGYFWFFSANNVEVVIKVVDGRAFNGFVWVFFGALSDVSYVITVTDTVSNAVKTYTNNQGTLASVADVTAFSGGPSCSYTVSSPNPASFGSGGGTGTVGVTTAAGCQWSAVSNNTSFLMITGGSSGTGSGTVSFSVTPNSSTALRSGTMTIAGQTVTITQAGTSGSGTYNGSWSGPTSQGRTVMFNVVNNGVTSFTLVFPLTGSCTQGSLGVIFGTPRPTTGGMFSFTSTSTLGSLSASGTFTSDTTATGTATYTLNATPPSFCSGSGSATWTATRPP